MGINVKINGVNVGHNLDMTSINNPITFISTHAPRLKQAEMKSQRDWVNDDVLTKSQPTLNLLMSMSSFVLYD